MSAVVGLYRVQNAAGEGPYCADVVFDLDSEYRKKVVRTFLDAHAKSSSDEHPSPSYDGLGWPRYWEKCAFASLKDLRRWFSAQELQTLNHHGFRPARVWVDADGVRRGRSQVVFDSAYVRSFV